MAVPCEGAYTEVLNSDAKKYGGYDTVNPEPIMAQGIPANKMNHSIEVKIPPLSVMVFKYDYIEEKKDEVVESDEKLVVTNKEEKAQEDDKSVKTTKKTSSTKKSTTKKKETTAKKKSKSKK